MSMMDLNSEDEVEESFMVSPQPGLVGYNSNLYEGVVEELCLEQGVVPYDSLSCCKFLTEPDDSLKCVICLEVANDPMQHDVCGRLFCTECIEKNGDNPCPNCRSKKTQYFKDRKSLREIRGLRVRCDSVERGCDWEGTVGLLGDHVSKCAFTLLSCPNQCLVAGKDLMLMRKDLDDHLETKCLNRDYKCKHCGEKGTYTSITEVHDGVCIKKVVPCPNTDCTVIMERGLTKKHVQTVCKHTLVACKYASIGCSVKKVRMDMNQHEDDDKSHLHLALEKIVRLVNTTSSLEDTISSLEATRSSELISFNLPVYSKKKEDDAIFCSEPFYTSLGGYRMCIEVYPNGNGDGRGTHVSLYSKLLEGPYNDNLPWPFLGTVTVHLLNQLADDNHLAKKMLFKTMDDTYVNDTVGCSQFIPHLKLSHNRASKTKSLLHQVGKTQIPGRTPLYRVSNTQYLMEDTLYFRVAVEVDHHKPWLDCTHLTK